MDAIAAPNGLVFAPGIVSLGSLKPGASASIVSVGAPTDIATALQRRLMQLGFIIGERIEVLAEARPGGDPFVVRVGNTTFAVRRREVENLWVEIAPAVRAP